MLQYLRKILAEGMAVEDKYRFLFKKTNLPQSRLMGLLEDEKFKRRIDSLMDNRSEIDAHVIYELVKELFFPMLEASRQEGFKDGYKSRYGTDKYHEWSRQFRLYGQATRRFSAVLFGEEVQQWEKDFESYLTGQ